MRRAYVLLGLLVLDTACSDADTVAVGGSDTTSTSGGDSSEGPAPVCTPGERTCDGDAVLVCTVDGDGWMLEPCSAEQVCTDGACMSVSDLHVITEVLIPADVGTA